MYVVGIVPLQWSAGDVPERVFPGARDVPRASRPLPRLARCTGAKSLHRCFLHALCKCSWGIKDNRQILTRLYPVPNKGQWQPTSVDYDRPLQKSGLSYSPRLANRFGIGNLNQILLNIWKSSGIATFRYLFYYAFTTRVKLEKMFLIFHQKHFIFNPVANPTYRQFPNTW